MKIIIHGTRMDLTPAIEMHIQEKFVALSRHVDSKHEALAEVRVEVGKPSGHHHKGDVFYAEANLKMGKELLRATSQRDDLYAAINECQQELDVQLQKHKTREQAHRK